MLGGDNVFSWDQVNIFLEALLEDEAKSCTIERRMVPDLNSPPRLAAFRLIFFQKFYGN
jgi:hypothetical protein